VREVGCVGIWEGKGLLDLIVLSSAEFQRVIFVWDIHFLRGGLPGGLPVH
jgi:hypothetical protein